MKLTDYLRPDHIVTGFDAENKTAALEKLCRLAADLHGLDYPAVLQVVLDREATGTTGLGGAVALPHGKTSAVDRSILLMALSRRGVPFDSLDGAPVKVFVLLLSPKDGEGREHLQLLAGLGRLLNSRSVVEDILAADDADEVFGLLGERE